MYVARSEKRIFGTCLTRLENVHREEKRKMYHILVVEDDRAILDGVGIYLKNQGYKVFKAQNGKERRGWRFLPRKRFIWRLSIS